MSGPWVFFKWSGKEKRYFFRALFGLIQVRLLFILLPYSLLQKRYSMDKTATKEDPETARFIRDAIRRAGKLSFWRNKCLVQTFVARKMLNKHKIKSQAYLGVQRHDQTLDFAHAWVVSSGIDVVPPNGAYFLAHEF